jgi:hypothetical protein
MIKPTRIVTLLLALVISFVVREHTAMAQNSLAFTPASAFMWTDRYLYVPGTPIVVRWTANANGDTTTPYTAVFYRQNNQTGVKTYYAMFKPSSASPMDILGRTPDQGFGTFNLGSVTKSMIIGPGGWASETLAAPAELGMHTFVMEIRDATGTRVVKSVYAKFGVVDGFDTISGDISTDRTLVNTRGYLLSGVVTVKSNATLTIQPGTIILGQPGSLPPSMLLIGVNGKIRAEGTRSRPIIMTSSQPFGSRNPGDWGGLVLLGKAPINVAGGTSNIEGLAPSADTTYGGTDPTHDCGTLAYVRVEFGGSILSTNNEINNVTWGACGSRTVTHHVQSRYGLDDMFEWFGGTNDAKFLIGQIGRDDYLDGQLGWNGRLQHAVVMAGTDVRGNRGVEMDNSEFNDRATPLGKAQIYNVTFVGSGDVDTAGFDEADSSALYLRRGAAGGYNNLLLLNWTVNGISIRDNTGSTATLESITRGDLSMNGILMWDNGKASGRPNTVDGQAADFTTTSNANARALLNGTLGNGRNVLVADPLIRRPFFRSDPDLLPRSGSPIFRANWVQPPDDGFFDQWARWNGAFGDVDWTEEWTVWAQEADIRN